MELRSTKYITTIDLYDINRNLKELDLKELDYFKTKLEKTIPVTLIKRTKKRMELTLEKVKERIKYKMED